MDVNDDGLEKLMNKLGDFGRYQCFQFILHVVAAIPTSMHMFSLVTVAAVPAHRCAIEGVDTANYTEPWNSTLVLNSIPLNHHGKLDSCHLYGENKSWVECHSWVYDTQYYKSSRGIEWNFVCNRRWMGAMAHTSFMTGLIVGSIVLGPLCDTFGRRTIYIWTGLLQILAGIAVAFTTRYYSFIALRFLIGIVGMSPFKAGYVLTIELVGPSKRAVCSTLFQLLWGVGVMILSVWSYFIDNRFYLQIIYALHAVVMLPHWFLMDESPRWLWAKGRIRESTAIIKKALKVNKLDATIDTAALLSDYKATHQEKKSAKKPFGIIGLFKTPNMRKKSVIIFGCFFAIAVVYYGLGLNTSQLNGNPYLMLFLCGFVDIPGILTTMYCVDRIGHRAILSTTMLLSGVCLLIVIALPHGSSLTVAAAMLGKLIISGAFSIVYKYGSELFPTVVRSTGVAVGTTWASLSGALTPMITLLDSFNPKIPNIVFGLLSITFGLCSLLLPETLGRRLPQTLEDGENFGLGDTCFTNCSGRRMSTSTLASVEATEPLNKK